MSMDAAMTYRPPRDASPPWGQMPGIDGRTVANAQSRLPLVRAALLGSKSVIMCVHIEMTQKRQAYKSSLWRTVDAGYQIIDGGTHLTPETLAEICGSFGPLARNLYARWPDRARPKAIGLATDGHRVVFNATHPACVGSQWLDDHLTGKAPGVSIVSDGTPGEIDFICAAGRAKP